MVALKAYFHFINNRFLNPKKAFWNAAKSWAADFCILIYSEYEKKKKVLFKVLISKMPENKYFLYLYFRALLFVK